LFELEEPGKKPDRRRGRADINNGLRSGQKSRADNHCYDVTVERQSGVGLAADGWWKLNAKRWCAKNS